MFPLKNLEEAKRYLNKHYLNQDRGLHFAICLQPDNFPIGYISVSGEDSHDFGYALQKEYWHQGIVTEASLAVVQFAKNTGIPYLTATHDINNPRSGAVMQKIGMTYRYSYEEQWQPKDFPVIFRMYQINFDGQNGRIYRKYWDKYPHHFMEQID